MRLISLSLALLSVSQFAFSQTRATPDDPLQFSGTGVEAGLRRSIGQARFFTAEQNYYYSKGGLESAMPVAAAARSADAAGGGERRDVVDSDVFNAGPVGSKILVLLNHSRGMMILNFERGANQPQLMGRVPPTGNYPTNMYVDWSTHRGIVIENWNRGEYGKGARIITYDLSDLSNPKAIQITEVGGTVNDSRLVGDVLYVIGHKMNNNYGYNSGDGASSYAKSFKITKDGLEPKDEKALANHVSWGENMGIQEVQNADGKYQYYITAVTYKNNRWGGWWATQSEVEVLDISSTDGQITPVLIASVKGRVEKRSWANIANGSLTVTSNYRSGEGSDAKLRVAVETFKLPYAGATKISEKEAQFRSLAAERAEEGSRALLLSAGDTQLRNVFIADDKGRLRKSMSDFEAVDFGDTTGQHASVQDVRYVKVGSRIQAQVFWVPANQIDPFDIVDVTNPQTRPVYQTRLQFDGWIARSIPLEFQGRNFAIGLGYVIPAVDNPKNIRIGQAKVFEIVRTGGRDRAVEIDTIELPKVQWSDVGGQDKLVGVQFDANTGKGSIVFKGQRYDQKEGFVEGGQTVNFDLAAEGDHRALSEGTFVKGDDGWLRRVFMHKNLDTVMTFSDQELGVFANNAAAGDKVVDAIARMELARNIVAFESVPSLNLGVQIVRKGDVWWDKKNSTEIRLVPLSHADAEKNQLNNLFSVEGSYAGHILNEQTGELLVLTAENTSSYDQNSSTTHLKTRVTRVNLRARDGAISQIGNEETKVYRYDQVQTNPTEREIAVEYELQGLVRIDGTTSAFVDGLNNIWKVTNTPGGLMTMARMQVNIPNEIKEGASQLGLKNVDGRIYLSVHKNVSGDAEQNSPLRIYRSYVAPVTISGDALTVKPSDVINIPGKLTALVLDKSGAVKGFLTQEMRVVDAKSGLLEPSLNALKLGSSGAELTSLMASSDSLQLSKTGNASWMFVEPVTNTQRVYRPMGFFPGRGRYNQQSEGFQLGMLDVSENGQLYRTVRKLDGRLTGYSANIVKTAELNESQTRVVIAAGDKIQVVDVSRDKTIKQLEIKPSNTFVTPVEKGDEQKSTVWNLPGYVDSYSYQYSPKSSVTLNGSKVQVSLGLYGVCEATLVDPETAPTLKRD